MARLLYSSLVFLAFHLVLLVLVVAIIAAN
jgi:hypothetical protein